MQKWGMEPPQRDITSTKKRGGVTSDKQKLCETTMPGLRPSPLRQKTWARKHGPNQESKALSAQIDEIVTSKKRIYMDLPTIYLW